MHRRGSTIVSLALLAAFSLSAAVAGDKSDMAGRIVVWERHYNSGDVDALAEQYTEDAVRMPYQAPKIEGRAAIASLNRTFREAGATQIDLELVGAESSGGMAWAHGTYHLKSADGSTFQTGKWMNVSKKVGKRWLIQADIWNTDAP